MSTQPPLKSTVRRSSRLNPTFKKKLGFQKLEIEFSSKAKKRNDSKVSPPLFDSQDNLTETSQKSELNVDLREFSVQNGQPSELADSQDSIQSTYEMTQFAGSVPRGLVASSQYDIRKFVRGDLNSGDFADEMKNLASEGLNSQNFVVGVQKLADKCPDSQDFVNAIREFTTDSLNSQDFAETGLKSGDFADVIFANDSLNSQNFYDEIGRAPNDDQSTQDVADKMSELINEDVSSEDFVDGTKLSDPNLDLADSTDHSFGPQNSADPNLNSQDSAASNLQNAEATKAESRASSKLKSIRNLPKAPCTVCDGNILPESFRKSSARASRKLAAVKCVTQKLPRSRVAYEAVAPCLTNVVSEPAKNQLPFSGPKRKRKRGTTFAPKPVKRTLRSTFSGRSTSFEPLKIEIISQKTVPSEMQVSLEPAKNLMPLSEPKRGRKARASGATLAVERETVNAFPDMSTLLEPLYDADVSQRTVPSQMSSSLESVENQPISKRKRGRKARVAAQPAKRNSKSSFPAISSLVEPLKIEISSQKTRSHSRKPKPELPAEPVRCTRLSEKKKTAAASAEMELCSKFSNWSIKCAEESPKSPVSPQFESFNPRQPSNVGTTGFLNFSVSDLLEKGDYSVNPEHSPEFCSLFSTQLNVGNYADKLDIRSFLRRVTKIELKLHHLVPPSAKWYEDFEIW